MTAEQVDAICMSLSGASRDDSLGPGVRSWAVGGRIFASMADGVERLSLRCADEKVAQLLVSHGRAGMLPNPPVGSWISLDLTIDDYELHCRIIESYDMVRGENG